MKELDITKIQPFPLIKDFFFIEIAKKKFIKRKLFFFIFFSPYSRIINESLEDFGIEFIKGSISWYL